jgi:endonuclease-3 related protein
MDTDRLRDLYDRLHAAYGPQGWWPATERFEIIAGAILTQRTAWRNAEQAIEQLRVAGLLSVAAVDDAPIERVIEAIRPAGCYHGKARRLKAFAAHTAEQYGGDLDRLLAVQGDELRRELLGLHGIGEETADAILVYAAGVPTFVVDAYARRLLARLGWIEGGEPYDQLRRMFLERLADDARQLGEYHALIVRHGKEHCRASPICADCPLLAICVGSVGDSLRDVVRRMPGQAL